MKAKTDLFPSTADCTVDPVSTLDGRDAALRKAEFVKPELTSHGDLVDLTAPFGGSLKP
jgi:hypothetical protein